MNWTRKAEESSESKRIELLKTVDISGLEQLISSKLGVPIKLETELSTRRNIVLRFQSQDLLKESGIFSTVLSKVYVSEFSQDFIEDDTRLWTSVSLRYEQKGGGSNGLTLFHVYYTFETKTWEGAEEY